MHAPTTLTSLALIAAVTASAALAAPPDEVVSDGVSRADGDPYRRAVRLGGLGAPNVAWSLGGALEMSGPPLPDTGLGLFGSVTAQIDLADIALGLRGRYGRSSGRSDGASLSHVLIGGELSAYKIFDLGPRTLALGFGVRAGLDYLTRRSDAPDRHPAHDQVVARLGPLLRLEWAPVDTLALDLDCGIDTYILDVPRDGDVTRDTPLVPYCMLGFAMPVGL